MPEETPSGVMLFVGFALIYLAASARTSWVAVAVIILALISIAFSIALFQGFNVARFLQG
jgi:hypothetical protein